MGWRGRGTFGPWPGRGPFSDLPPWQRPGWVYGPGACWRLFGPRVASFYSPSEAPSVTEQIKNLEAYKKEVEEEMNEINKQIERLKKEAQGKTKNAE